MSVQNVYPTEGANDYEFSISHSSSPTTVGGVTLGSGGTNALSSSSNKLIVSVSAIGVMNSDVSSDHWRLFVQGTGMPDPSTHTNADGFPLNLNFYYEITHYHEEILSTQLLVTPGTTTPSYYIRCVNAQGSGTFTIKHINWVFMEVQA